MKTHEYQAKELLETIRNIRIQGWLLSVNRQMNYESAIDTRLQTQFNADAIRYQKSSNSCWRPRKGGGVKFCPHKDKRFRIGQNILGMQLITHKQVRMVKKYEK